MLSAHTHHGCYRVHNNGVPEWTVASFSWRNKPNPTFLLVIQTNPMNIFMWDVRKLKILLTIEKCRLFCVFIANLLPAIEKDVSNTTWSAFVDSAICFQLPPILLVTAEGSFLIFPSNEPRHEKTNVLVSDLVQHKPGFTATEDG